MEEEQAKAVILVSQRILQLRNQTIILDKDLAGLYGVTTKALLQALRRNKDRFPDDFAFQINELEWANLRSQFVTSSSWGGRRYLPWAFTEHGALQVANVLKSGSAVAVSLLVVRAFVRLRQLAERNQNQRTDPSALRQTSGEVRTHAGLQATQPEITADCQAPRWQQRVPNAALVHARSGRGRSRSPACRRSTSVLKVA